MKSKIASGRAGVERGWEGSRLEGDWLAQAYEQIEPVSQKSGKKGPQHRGTKPAVCVSREGSDGVGEDSSGVLCTGVLGVVRLGKPIAFQTRALPSR